MPLALFLLWIFLNGRVTGDVIVSGALAAFLVSVFCGKYMDYHWRKDLAVLDRAGWFARYVLRLVKEMVVANIQVIGLVLSPELKLRPCIVRFRSPVRSSFGRILLANSITLTPGTITGDLTDKGYTVHALTPEMAAGMENSIFVRLIREMEGGA